MINSNLYKYLKRIFPDKTKEVFTGKVVFKDSNFLVLEDATGRRMKVNNLTGVNYTLGSELYSSDGLVIGRTSKRGSIPIKYV